MFPTWKHGLISPCSTWSKRWGIHPWSDQMLDTWSCFKNQPWLNNFDSKCRHFSSFFRYGSRIRPQKNGIPSRNWISERGNCSISHHGSIHRVSGLREAKLLLGQDSDSDGEPDAKKADLKHGEILRVKMCQNPVGLQRHTEIQNMI